MSRIVTKEQLVNKIDKEIGWRKKELKIFKDNIPRQPSPMQVAFLRAATAILYAHWEGYVKKVCEFYLDYVSEQNEEHCNLKPQFIALSLNKHFGKLETRNIAEKTKSVKFIVDNLNVKANFQGKGNINTKSNLRYSVFQDIAFTVNLDETLFAKYETLIDDLVNARNTIAHGSYHKVFLSTFDNMYADIIEAMETLRTELENAAVLNKHRIEDILD